MSKRRNFLRFQAIFLLAGVCVILFSLFSNFRSDQTWSKTLKRPFLLMLKQRVENIAGNFTEKMEIKLQAIAPRQTQEGLVQTQEDLEQQLALQDLAAAQEDENCWNHFDFGMLNAWNSTIATFCEAPPSSIASEDSVGWLRCRVQIDEHLPPPTAPHTMCDGANIVLDLGKMSPTNCLASRLGYMCDEPRIWYSYAPGALSANCSKTAAFTGDKFPNDHLKDMFAAFAGGSDVPAAAAVAAPVVLIAARERGELPPPQSAL